MASTVVELLRRRFGGSKEVDPYEGVLFNAVLSTNNTTSASTKFCVTPYYETIAGTYTLYFGVASDTGQISIAANAPQDGGVRGAFRNKTSITLSGGIYFRCALIQAEIDNCWVKDPNGQYLFKGKNV